MARGRHGRRATRKVVVRKSARQIKNAPEKSRDGTKHVHTTRTIVIDHDLTPVAHALTAGFTSPS